MRVQISTEKFIAEKMSDSNRKMDKDAYKDADGYKTRQSTRGVQVETSREHSVEVGDSVKRSHDGEMKSKVNGREISIEAVDKAKRHHEGKDSHSLKDNIERSIDVVDWAGRSHEGKDSHFYRDSNER